MTGLEASRGAGDWRLPGAASLLTGLAVAVALAPGAAGWAEYERGAIAAGEWWRLLTGHWAHWSWGHLGWDGLAFLALGLACERLSRGRFLACVAGSGLAVSAAVWWLAPAMERYRGLSGIDSALFVLLAVSLMQADAGSRRLGPAAWALVAFLAKVTYESATGHAIFVADDAASVVPVAHLAGAGVGLALGLTVKSSLLPLPLWGRGSG